MEWDKMALWFLVFIAITIVLCATIYGSLSLANQTAIEREVIACDYACPSEDGHCVIECVKALNIERNEIS